MAKRKKIVKKSKGKALTSGNWRKEMAKHVADEEAREAPQGGNRISTINGKFSYNGMPLAAPMNSVIVDFVYENVFYDSTFDADNPGTPACFALSVTGKEMVPHDDAPNKQSKTCEECPNNVWGSGARGRSKACSQRRRLALMHEDDMEDTENAALAILSISPTGLAAWKAYYNKITKVLGAYMNSVVTSFDIEEGKGGGYHVVEQIASEIKALEIYQGVEARESEARELLMTPYDVTNYEKPRARKTAKKAKKAKKTRKGRW